MQSTSSVARVKVAIGMFAMSGNGGGFNVTKGIGLIVQAKADYHKGYWITAKTISQNILICQIKTKTTKRIWRGYGEYQCVIFYRHRMDLFLGRDRI